MTELFLDTTVAKESQVTVSKNGKVLTTTKGGSPLPAVVESLEKAHLGLEDIDSFLANEGPGSYTGIRVGLAVVNCLNWALGKKVKPLEPKYQ